MEVRQFGILKVFELVMCTTVFVSCLKVSAGSSYDVVSAVGAVRSTYFRCRVVGRKVWRGKNVLSAGQLRGSANAGTRLSEHLPSSARFVDGVDVRRGGQVMAVD